MLELSSLCSRPSLGPRAEPGEGRLLASPKREKVQENKLHFLLSASSLRLSRTSSYRSPAEPEQGPLPAWCQLRLAGAGGKQHHSTSQQQGDKVGFGASRVQGIPKPPRGTVGPPWLFPGSHPKDGLSREQLPLPRAVGRSSVHIALLPRTDKCSGPSCWDRGPPPCASSRAVPGLYNPHQ